MNVLKKLFLAVVLLLFSSSSFATVFLHSPVEAKVSGNERIQLGKVTAGQTIVVVIEKKSEKAEKWDSVFVDASLLPLGWGYDVKVAGETITTEIIVPKGAKVASQRINLKALNSRQPELADAFFADVSVVGPENVFTAGIDLSRVETRLGEKVLLNITISNNSIATASFLLSSNLPSQWLQARELTVEPQSTKTFSLGINPLVYGKRNAVVALSSEQNGFSEGFAFELNVFPTIAGKFQAPFFGLPFFSLTLWPYYLVNSLLSLL